MATANIRNMNISVCEKKLWLDAHSPEKSVRVFDMEGSYANNSVRELICSTTPDCMRVRKGDPDDMAAETLRLIDIARKNRRQQVVIADAVFVYYKIIVYIDRLLLNKDGSFDFCEIKAATHVRDGFVEDVSFKYAVLKILGYKIGRVFIGYINGDYVRRGPVDVKKFLLYKNVTDSVEIYSCEMIPKIKDSIEYKNEPCKKICSACLSPRRCSYWKYCTRNLSEHNVFDIAGLALDKKFELYHDGILSFEDIEKAACLTKRQMRQVETVLHTLPPEIDKKSLEKFLSELYYPLYFLDFETFQSAIPKYNGVKPFTQIPFQFSLHYIETGGGELSHREFLAECGCDPRRELAEKLVEYIPENACVLAYNMAFEKGVIRSLAGMFDDFSVSLMKIHDNIKDLMIPFQKQFYYDRKMMGSYSIKAVLPALFPDNPDLDYANLDLIHNGIEAMILYQQAMESDDIKRAEICDALLKYCGLDTLAMVKIWNKLCETVYG